jgi:hypothetical protein
MLNPIIDDPAPKAAIKQASHMLKKVLSVITELAVMFKMNEDGS